MAPDIQDGDIAIIGMSCRTAGANSPSELWDLLAKSKDVQSEITQFNVEGFYHPEGAPRKGLTNVKDAYMLDDDIIDKFDNAFFHTTPPEAVAMDPQQRMLLEIAYEAIENGGIPLNDFVGTDTAVYAGMEGCDYHTILARDLNATPRYLATGTPTCMAANRLSYFFDPSGPSMSVDTACSSTMAALHQAVRTLQHGDSKMALVCGAKLILNPDIFMPSSELGFLSPSGRCQSFDAAGDGYGRGEGFLAILLKPLTAAIASGDPVRSIIKGTRLNQDGRTQGITLPSADAQKSNMEGLYQELGIEPEDIQYIEAHGTGTAAGDPIEFSAINSVYKPGSTTREPLIVGSVKSNIGHLEACSALASIVKVTECLERGKIPAQMHFRNPNPKIDFSNVIVPTAITPWPGTRGNSRTAAINTFGAGGTNGHAVLESYSRRETKPSEESDRPLLFKVSAADEQVLEAMCKSYAAYVQKAMPNIHNLAHTLLHRRSMLRKSIFFSARTADEVVQRLKFYPINVRTKGSHCEGKILFVFTGQGAQWAEMGKALIDGSPLFRRVIVECDQALADLPDKPLWTILEELRRGKEETNVHKAEYSQPLCTALQLGLVALLNSWGLKPDAVVGHSSGEIAAAYAAGFISAQEAIINSYYRGSVLSRCASTKNHGYKEGAMCAVGIGEDQAVQMLKNYGDRLQLAAVNSPTSCTISGDREAVEQVILLCKEQGHFCRELRVDVAYHSNHMVPVAKEYRNALDQVNVYSQKRGTKCKMFSSVTGTEFGPRDCTPDYWGRNMTSTVKFCPTIEACLAEFAMISAAVDFGPHPALKGPVTEIARSLRKTDLEYFHTCMRGGDDFEALLDSVGSMVAHGIPLKLQNVNAREIVRESQSTYEYGSVITDLPGYQWNHSTGF